MNRSLILAIIVSMILCAIDASAARAVNDSAVDGGSVLVARDALATVEANRPKIIARMVDQYRQALQTHAIPIDAFRAALWELAPDRLLAASLADGIEEVNAIVAQALSSRVDTKDDPGSGANSWIG